MAASPVSIVPAPVSNIRRRPLAVTQRRIEANRRNAARSTGPRTAEGKARVARNPIKHGFFVAQDRWTPTQCRDFEETLTGLRDELKPDGILEGGCVVTMAQSYVRMAAMLRYENIAALKYHQHRERELNDRIAAADAAEAARLKAERDRLRRAGLWRPTIPGPRDAMAIVRYSGSLDRAIRRATSELEGLKKMRLGVSSSRSILQKQTHSSTRVGHPKTQKQTHFEASPSTHENAKTNRCEASPNSVLRLGEGPRVAPTSAAKNAKANPLSSMFTGNRHARRRAKALARGRR